jgi:hypothetical protein
VGRDIDLILATQNFMSKENNTKPATQKRKNKIKQQIIKKKKKFDTKNLSALCTETKKKKKSFNSSHAFRKNKERTKKLSTKYTYCL